MSNLSALGKLSLMYDPSWGTKTIALATVDGLDNLKVLIVTPSMWNDAKDVIEALNSVENPA